MKKKMERIHVQMDKELVERIAEKQAEIKEKTGLRCSRSFIVRELVNKNIENFMNEPENGTRMTHDSTTFSEEKTGISGKANIEPESQKKSIWAETIEEIVDKVPLSEIEISSIEQLRRDYETSTGIEQGQVIAYMDDLIEQINYNAFKEVGK